MSPSRRCIQLSILSTVALGGCAFDGVSGGEDPDDSVDPLASCTEQFSDDFDDGLTGSFWVKFVDDVEVATSAAVREAEGALILDPPPPDLLEGFTGYCATTRVSLLDAAVRVELLQPPVNYLGEVQLSIDGDNLTEYAAMSFLEGELTRYISGGPIDDVSRAAYDPIAHRFLQIRESAGSLFFEASPDGRAWSELSHFPTPLFTADVEVCLGVLAGDDGIGPARLDNLLILDCGE